MLFGRKKKPKIDTDWFFDRSGGRTTRPIGNIVNSLLFDGAFQPSLHRDRFRRDMRVEEVVENENGLLLLYLFIPGRTNLPIVMLRCDGSVVGYLTCPLWTTPTSTFLDTNCIIFDTEEENKLEYTPIYHEFRGLFSSSIELSTDVYLLCRLS